MCLNIRKDCKRDGLHKPIPRRAEKDIICYKRLERLHSKKAFRTPFQGFIVKIGQRMKAKLGIGYHTVNEGIHAFSSKRHAISTAYHKQDVVVECIIPEGALYIRGENSDIVATEMKLKRIIHKSL